MTLIDLLVFVLLVVLMLYIASHLPAPFSWAVAGVLAIVVLVVLLRFLGVDAGTSVTR